MFSKKRESEKDSRDNDSDLENDDNYIEPISGRVYERTYEPVGENREIIPLEQFPAR
jgi:hypothetical protein